MRAISDEIPLPTTPIDLDEAVVRHDKLVVLGDPGSGKTTLLRYLALHEAGEAAGAVSTVLHLVAIRIEDPVVEIHIGAAGWFDLQQLIETDSEMTIGQPADLFAVEPDRAGDQVENHKVISQSLHFGEWHFHIADILLTDNLFPMMVFQAGVCWCFRHWNRTSNPLFPSQVLLWGIADKF